MIKQVFVWVLATVFLTTVFPLEAQQVAKVPRIGYLSTGAVATDAPRIEAFRQGLRELGYVEGKNINIEYRYAEGRFERVPELAEELIRLKVDILLVSSIAAAETVRKVTATIPIVVANAGNPFGSGLVASLARPGGNVTGLYQFSPELLGKRLELLKEVVPKVSRFAFLNAADAPAAKSMFKEAQVAAKALGVQFQLVEVKAQNPDLEGAFRIMVKERIGALVTEASGVISFHRRKILQLVEQNRMPGMHSDQEWANAGGLMSYGANRVDLYRRAAVYVDKILKGAKPAELPMEQPTKFELVINLKTAKQIGLTIPQTVLYRADKVIK
jgi:putative tryptophan/tyrosine transport system substrate-binding protein